MEPIDADQLRRRVRDLPALPEAVLEALAALRDDDASTGHCAALIGRDQALAARTLRLANSAFYGVSGRVGSVRDAVQLLGRRTLCSVMTLASVSQQFQPENCPPFDFGSFWRHAVATGIVARALAQQHHFDQDQAFTAGLLHDIGRLAMATYFPQATAETMRRATSLDVGLDEIEHSLLGTDHSTVGALVAAQWHFAAEVTGAIAGHHNPEESGATSLADIVHVADAVAHALDLAGDPREMVPHVQAATWERVVPSPRLLLPVFADTEAGVAALCTALGL
jgi:putative nucleotidyltransferase with HDIG domain